MLYGTECAAQPKLPIPADTTQLKQLANGFCFLIANDLGRNGYYDQQPIADMMGEVAAIVHPEFVAALGDVHHFMGVQSVNDPLWTTNFERVYSHPELMIPWYPVLGNHEYRGNTQAVLDYAKVSRRWQMPSRYYSKTVAINDSVAMLLLFIDTTPLISKYRKDSTSEASKQTITNQLEWIDSTLAASTARWKVVMGHHPVYSGTLKSASEQADLQRLLLPMLDKHGVTAYICGHIHSYQHIAVPSSSVEFVVSSSGSLAREVVSCPGMVASSAQPGFLVCSATGGSISLAFIGKDGRVIDRIVRRSR